MFENVMSYLGGGLCQLYDGRVVRGTQETEFGVGNTPIDRPFSSWHPIGNGNGNRGGGLFSLNGVVPETRSDEKLPKLPDLIKYITFNWKVVNPANLSSFWSTHGHLLEVNCGCPYLSTCQLQYGVSSWGRMFQMVEQATVKKGIRSLPLPVDEFFEKTFGEPAESTYNNGGHAKDDWWYFAYDDVQHLDMHIEGPLDHEWWDYGPEVSGRIYALSPAPPIWHYAAYRELFEGIVQGHPVFEFLFSQQLLGMANSNVLCGWDIRRYLHNPPEFPESHIDGQEFPEGRHDIGTYTATETWSFFTEEVEEEVEGEGGEPETITVTEYVFLVVFSSPHPHKRGDTIDPIEEYREWPLTNTQFELRSRSPFIVSCLFRQRSGEVLDDSLTEFPLELNGDAIIFNYSQEVTAWWHYSQYMGWQSLYDIDETRTVSCTENTNDDSDHYFGISLPKSKTFYPLKMVVVSVTTEQPIAIAQLAGKNGDSHIYEGSDKTCLVAWDFAAKTDDWSHRMFIFGESGRGGVSGDASPYIQKQKPVDWGAFQWFSLSPSIPTWNGERYFIDVNGYGDFLAQTGVDLRKQSGLIFSVFKNGYRYQLYHPDEGPPAYILEDPDNPLSDRIYDAYTATIQIEAQGKILHLWAGLGTIERYELGSEDENPYPIIVTYELDEGSFSVIDENGDESTSHYFSGWTRIKRHFVDTGFFTTGAQCFVRILS